MRCVALALGLVVVVLAVEQGAVHVHVLKKGNMLREIGIPLGGIIVMYIIDNHNSSIGTSQW